MFCGLSSVLHDAQVSRLLKTVGGSVVSLALYSSDLYGAFWEAASCVILLTTSYVIHAMVFL